MYMSFLEDAFSQSFHRETTKASNVHLCIALPWLHAIAVHDMVKCWSNYKLLLLLFCFVAFFVSEETKFEVGTTSIIITYLYS